MQNAPFAEHYSSTSRAGKRPKKVAAVGQHEAEPRRGLRMALLLPSSHIHLCPFKAAWLASREKNLALPCVPLLSKTASCQVRGCDTDTDSGML